MSQFKQLLIVVSTLVSSTLSFAQIPQVAPSWTGLYNDEQKISLFLQQKGSDITGYSLLNGKQTNFKGKIQQTDLNYTLNLNEVGQGSAVGRFVLDYSGNTSAIEAQWSSVTKTVKPKFFSLNAQQCKYAKGQGEFPEASSRLLKDADLQVPLGQLQYMRNEIYARHGYAFQNKKWANTFSQSEWYMPCYTNVDARLTSTEKENVKRIKLVEPYAKDVDWGR
ncbi:YARHG domain-containing protein [Acinetobacter gyllenbergii]|uniref:YARHG domain-containing protein n=1 Tax=Acinetobacter gyllenbergii TaxID=134534 RepID=UPI0021CE4ED6|nr:YARHG domain-containing protein [Acinetobacter gyllenbergii]MCU4580276.1 YARHG domain-containing protein [Acinetobacter gyllenbergii]